MNTWEFLSITAAICPEKEAIVFEGNRPSYRQLHDRANRLASVLLQLGMEKGDRVALMQVNTSQCIESYFAVAKSGSIYVPLNFRARANELSYMIGTAEVAALFVGERYLEIIDTIRSAIPTVRHFISLDRPHPGMLFYEELIAQSASDDVGVTVDDSETTILMYTAGTTGFPKGVMLTHNSFSVYVLENVTPADPDTNEKNILTVPLYHVAGTQAMMAAIYGGRTLVMQRQFEPKQWMELVEKEKVSRAMMVPTMLKQVLDHPEFSWHDLSSLKIITYGAAPMPIDIISRAVLAFPRVGFINAFGQTETASTVTVLGPEDHVISGSPEEREKRLKRLSSIGKPMSDVEIKVVDEDGNDLQANQIGEIVARGPRVMAGYWKDQEKTRKTIDPQGWVHTGDMGYRDEDGYFFLSGRTTDMIKRGGELISPEEIERVLQANPKVEELAVVGIPDEEWGEVPICVCVLRKGETSSAEELMEYCRANLASYKRPRAVVFCNEMPRNPLGKVLKRTLRDMYKDFKVQG
jgi:acyl-CoA synthetase (AMP-forming)/AMP-acid ligase II